MNAHRHFSRALVCVAACAVLPACESLVDVKLTLIEPCNQRNQALSGVGGLRVSIDGFTEPVTQEITVTANLDPVDVRGNAEIAQVTVEGFNGNPDTDGATVFAADPQSIGRTLPFAVNPDSPDLDVTLSVGLVDGVGTTTNLDGQCQAGDTGIDAAPGRHGHTATYIPEIEKVLIAGGAVWFEQDGQVGEGPLKSAELYDPKTGTFEFVGDMPTTRAYHSATYIGDGKVLLAGGVGVISGAVTALKAALIFDANATGENRFDDQVPPMVNERAFHTATFIEGSNQVLYVGGCVPDTDANPVATCSPDSLARNRAGDDVTVLNSPVEYFDVAENRFVAANIDLLEPRALHSASVITGNRVLVSGGGNSTGPVCSIEIFQTDGTTVSRVEPPGNAVLSPCPVGHVQITVDENPDRVAFVGGRTTVQNGLIVGDPSDEVIFWNSIVGVEDTNVIMQAGRYRPAAFALDDASVVVIGGEVAGLEATAERLVPEIVDPLAPAIYTASTLTGPPPTESRQAQGATLMPNNQVFVSGGHTADRTTSEDSFVYYGR